MPRPCKTIFVDVSEIVVMGGRSGIQRVVRRIVQEAAIDADRHYRIEPVVSMANGLRRLNDLGRTALFTVDGAGRRDGSAPLILKKDSLLLRSAKRLLRLMPRLYEQSRNRKIEKSFHSLIDASPIAMTENDVYVLVDSFWTRSSAPDTAARLRRRGQNVVALIHDALMLTQSGYVSSDVSRRFTKELRRMTDAGVPLISISRSSADDIKRALAVRRDVKIGYFYHGHDLPAPDTLLEVKWPALLWSSTCTFLVVGTFEPRKNQQTVLRAFETLWDAGFDGHLVMVGQIGVGSEGFVKDLARHPRLGTTLFVQHNAGDAAVLDAYRRATALILPSFVEGFGLPLVEGLGLGLPVIASDIAVFREIGSDACRFFDPQSSDALVDAVRDVASDLAPWRRRAASFAWINWREATRRFVAAVEAAVQ